jgi:ketosteroid isomerase-like protein
VDDYEAIRQLLARYAHIVDGPEPASVAQLFEPDGEFELLGELFKGRDAVAGSFQQFADLGVLEGKRHLTVNTLIEVDGDTATAVSDWLVPSLDAETGAWTILAVGRYEDVLAKSDRWQFRFRRDLIVGPPPEEALAGRADA